MGYFSSIARQAGLRIAGQLVANDVRLAQVARPMPPEVEEVVTVDPAETEPSVRGAHDGRPIASHAAAPPRPVEPVADRGNHPPAKPIVTEPPVSAATFPSHPPIHQLDREADSVTPVAHVAEVEAAPQALRIEEAAPQTLRIEEARPPHAKGVRLEVDVRSADAHAAPQRLEPERDAPRTNGFFIRTAEIIDAPAPDPIELQTAMLHDVQEWVAAVPEAPAAKPERSNRIARIAVEVEHPEFDEPVQQVPRHRQTQPALVVDSPPVMAVQEQSFELSIGTIHVVIEGDVPRHSPPPPLQRPVAPDPRSGEQRPVSLGRHYL